VPVKVYLKNNRAKLELGLARGKKQYDKRQSIAERDAKREIDRAIKNR
jgi:SsrA-binding protein